MAKRKNKVEEPEEQEISAEDAAGSNDEFLDEDGDEPIPQDTLY